jgi:magnesium transporter
VRAGDLGGHHDRRVAHQKQLTIIATIFLPLTFLTGFFGQNFAFLTDHIINHSWTFFVFGIGLLLVSAIGFRIYFKRKSWL